MDVVRSDVRQALARLKIDSDVPPPPPPKNTRSAPTRTVNRKSLAIKVPPLNSETKWRNMYAEWESHDQANKQANKQDAIMRHNLLREKQPNYNNLEIDQLVIVKYQPYSDNVDSGKWYKGKVCKKHNKSGLVDILYDDCEIEFNVLPIDIKQPGEEEVEEVEDISCAKNEDGEDLTCQDNLFFTPMVVT